MYISDYEVSSYVKQILKDLIMRYKTEIEKGMFSEVYDAQTIIPRYLLTYLLIKSGINPLQDMNSMPSSFCASVDKLELEIPERVKYLNRGSFSDIDDCTITFEGIPKHLEDKVFDGIFKLVINFPGRAEDFLNIIPVNNTGTEEQQCYDYFKGNKQVILNCLDQTIDLVY